MARRYPRLGEPLAPRMLRQVLNRPIGSIKSKVGYSRLKELDSGAWRVFSSDQCTKLADEIVDAVRAGLPSLPAPVLDRRIPGLPRGYGLEDLGVDTRTWNCLNRAGIVDDPPSIKDWTIGEFLEARSVGARVLVDLLTALEATRLRAQRGLDEELTYQAERALRVAGGEGLTADDPRLGSLITDIDGRASSLDRLLTRLMIRRRDPQKPDEVADALRKLRLQVRKLRKVSLEEELQGIVCSVSPGRGDIVARLRGFDGRGGATLQVVGDEFGVTREAVRQIAKKAISKLEGRNVYAPRLDDAVALVDESTPCSAEEATRLLRDAGISRADFDVRGIVEAASVMSRTINFELASNGDQRSLVPPGRGNVPRMLASESRRLISSQGVATIADVASRVGERAGSSIGEDFASSFLTKTDGFSWLEQDSGWFWLKELPRNRLLNFIDKIMSVADFVDIAEIRQGVSRNYRMKGLVPPTRVLLELCKQVDRFQVDGAVVRDEPPLDYEEVLEGTEETMARILLDHGPLLTGKKLEEMCLSAGMNASTFNVYLGNSPIIARYARGVYGLVGAQFAPGAAEALVQKRSSKKVLQDYGWSADGGIWVKYEMSENLVKSGVATVPAAMRDYLTGSFELTSEDKVRVGTFTADGGSGWGLGNLFRRRGGEPGDFLVLNFDLKRRACMALIREREPDLEALLESLDSSQQTVNGLDEDYRPEV